MKKILVILLTLALSCSLLTACGQGNSSTATDQKAESAAPAEQKSEATTASEQTASSASSEVVSQASSLSSETSSVSESGEAEDELPVWEYEIVWSDGGTKDGVSFIAAEAFSNYVEEHTNGNVTFSKHWESELFGPPAEIEAIKNGEIDMAGIHHAFAGSISPLVEFMTGVGARGVFDSLEHYWRFIDSPEMKELVEKEVAEKFNSKLLYMNPVSTSTVASSVPIHTMEDFANIQIRTPGTASANAYSAMGASPVSMNASEIYMALERGVIQAADTGSDEIYKKAFYEVTPYIVRDFSCYPPHALVSINLDLWNSMPAEYQAIFEEAAEVASSVARETVVEQDEELLGLLEPLVEEIYFFPDEEVAKVCDLLAPMTKDTFFENNDPEVAQLVWDYVESTR